MKMQKNQMRIGQLAQHLGVERFVIRFWEKEFGIKANRSEGMQRWYSQKELELFSTIKHLLYEKHYTIQGARQELHGKVTKQTTKPITTTNDDEKTLLEQQVVALKSELLILREQLEKLKKHLA